MNNLLEIIHFVFFYRGSDALQGNVAHGSASSTLPLRLPMAGRHRFFEGPSFWDLHFGTFLGGGKGGIWAWKLKDMKVID